MRMFSSDALIFDVAAAGIKNDIFYVQTVYFSQNRLLLFRVSAIELPIELPCIAAYPLGSSDFFINIKNDIFTMLYDTVPKHSCRYVILYGITVGNKGKEWPNSRRVQRGGNTPILTIYISILHNPMSTFYSRSSKWYSVLYLLIKMYTTGKVADRITLLIGTNISTGTNRKRTGGQFVQSQRSQR